MAAVIETEGLTKQWGDLVAVDHLDLAVEQGECYAFLGRNGSGKSTTARMLLDFIRPTAGTSRLLGGVGSDPAVRARVGYLPGDLNLPRTMTGDDAFDFFGGLSGVSHDPDRETLIERFGLDPSRPVRELSTGNRRKVGLVLAFMGAPELLDPRRAHQRARPGAPGGVPGAARRAQGRRRHDLADLARHGRGRAGGRSRRPHPRRPHGPRALDAGAPGPGRQRDPPDVRGSGRGVGLRRRRPRVGRAHRRRRGHRHHRRTGRRPAVPGRRARCGAHRDPAAGPRRDLPRPVRREGATA